MMVRIGQYIFSSEQIAYIDTDARVFDPMTGAVDPGVRVIFKPESPGHMTSALDFTGDEAEAIRYYFGGYALDLLDLFTKERAAETVAVVMAAPGAESTRVVGIR